MLLVVKRSVKLYAIRLFKKMKKHCFSMCCSAMWRCDCDMIKMIVYEKLNSDYIYFAVFFGRSYLWLELNVPNLIKLSLCHSHNHSTTSDVVYSALIRQRFPRQKPVAVWTSVGPDGPDIFLILGIAEHRVLYVRCLSCYLIPRALWEIARNGLQLWVDCSP